MEKNRKISFETSVGMVEGLLKNDNNILFSDESKEKLNKLYLADLDLSYLEDGWVKIWLEDCHYGLPEYKAIISDKIKSWRRGHIRSSKSKPSGGGE